MTAAPEKPSSKPANARATPASATPLSRRLLVPLAVVVLGLSVLAGAIFAFVDRGGPSSSAVGGPFALVDQNGATVTDKSLAGEPYLVFFGFTHCPDICPTTLYEASEMLAALGKDVPAKVLFVTVDPERDTPEILKSYLGSFDPRITGLSGTPEQIAAIMKAYRAYARKVPLKGDDYTMDHTAVVYLMDKNGRFVNVFDLKRAPAEAAADFRRYL